MQNLLFSLHFLFNTSTEGMDLWRLRFKVLKAVPVLKSEQRKSLYWRQNEQHKIWYTGIEKGY
jgi:hypothetical protein